MTLVARISRLFAPLLDLAFPRACLGCQAPETLLCPRCRRALPRSGPLPECLPDAGVSGQGGVETSALFAYQDPVVEKLVWTLKYRGDRATAAIFAHELHDLLLEELADRALFSGVKPLVIPIPLAPKRERWRGFNQMRLVGEKLAAIAGDTIEYRPDILKKTRETSTQTKLARTARLKNLAGAFAIRDENAIRGRTIILIDDVITTGATMSEAAKALKRAGAREVIGIALAH